MKQLHQLSLFDSPPLAARPPSAPAAAVPAAPAPPRPRPTAATRELRLAGHVVRYALRRARRRTIGFTVDTDGLRVSAPRWVTIAEIDAALREKGDWIVSKLAEARERAHRLEAARIDWRDGARVPFLGEDVIIVIDPRAVALPGAAVLHNSEARLPGVPRLTLHLGLPPSAGAEQIRDAAQSWLQHQARRVFDERCHLYAERLAVRVTRLKLSSAATQWGSASADGAVRLNWRLIHFAMPVIDYVVAHELAHLREMNHSARFWNLVRSVLPGFEQARGALRDPDLPQL